MGCTSLLPLARRSRHRLLPLSSRGRHRLLPPANLRSIQGCISSSIVQLSSCSQRNSQRSSMSQHSSSRSSLRSWSNQQQPHQHPAFLCSRCSLSSNYNQLSSATRCRAHSQRSSSRRSHFSTNGS